MSRPEGLVMVTDTGLRIPIDLRLEHVDPDTGIRYWQPVIEGDLDKIMPSVVAFDGPPVGVGESVSFFKSGPGWDTAEWGQRVMSNSRHVFSWYQRGDTA